MQISSNFCTFSRTARLSVFNTSRATSALYASNSMVVMSCRFDSCEAKLRKNPQGNLIPGAERKYCVKICASYSLGDNINVAGGEVWKVDIFSNFCVVTHLDDFET